MQNSSLISFKKNNNMIRTFIFSLFIFQFLKMHSQTNIAVIDKSMAAYNNRNIDDFMACFSEDIAIYNYEDNSKTISGLNEVRKMYTELFDLSPKLHSTIKNRIIFDNKIIDHEYIEGRRGSDIPMELVLIYEVKEEKIFKIKVIRK
jgi:hypothetical protein